MRKAAELAQPGDTSTHSSDGLTLAEMKPAAAQAGIAPALVERAARLLASGATAVPSVLERLLGGRARCTSEIDVPVVLDEVDLAQLLSAIRIAVGRPGDGHSSAFGLTWRSVDEAGAVLHLVAQTDHEGTAVTAELDRRRTLATVTSLTGVVSMAAFIFGGTVVSGVAPGFELAGALLGVVGVVAVARSFWRSSTRTAHDRLSAAMDSVSRFLIRPRDVASDDGREVAASAESGRYGNMS